VVTITGRSRRKAGAPKVWLLTIAVSSFIAQFTIPSFAQEGRKIRMAYSAFSVAFLNIFVAHDAGLFKKQALDVELIQMAGPLPIAALSAGEIDYLTGYTTGLVAAGQGAPLKGLIVTMRKPPFYIVSEPSLQKPEDLAGKRFAVDRIGSLQHLVARVFLKTKGVNSEKVIFTQTGSVSNTVTSLGQGAVSAALLSGPHNVIMVQKGFRQIGAADELPVSFPTSGLVVHEAKIKSDAARIKTVIRVMLDSLTFSQREKGWMTNYVKDKWKLDAKVAQTVYEQWLSTLAPDGKVNPKELQEYFDLAYSFKQIPAPVHVPAVTDYTLLDQVLAGK
jgi:ABC-type nitrate/sulfonate/bicarbonate transport system substrate-binding protein